MSPQKLPLRRVHVGSWAVQLIGYMVLQGDPHGSCRLYSVIDFFWLGNARTLWGDTNSSISLANALDLSLANQKEGRGSGWLRGCHHLNVPSRFRCSADVAWYYSTCECRSTWGCRPRFVSHKLCEFQYSNGLVAFQHPTEYLLALDRQLEVFRRTR
jgi:hypothetical protein